MSKRITTDQIGELVAQDKAGRVTRDDLDAFLKSPSHWRDDALPSATTPSNIKTGDDGYRFKIDYGLTVVQMVALGNYGWANPDITTENFPHDSRLGEVEVTAEVIHFGKCMSTDAVLAELDSRRLRPATMAELLAFGAAFPEEQRNFPIVALGSVWTNPDGRRVVGGLGMEGSRRDLDFYCVGGDWNGNYRFLAVCK